MWRWRRIRTKGAKNLGDRTGSETNSLNNLSISQSANKSSNVLVKSTQQPINQSIIVSFSLCSCIFLSKVCTVVIPSHHWRLRTNTHKTSNISRTRQGGTMLVGVPLFSVCPSLGVLQLFHTLLFFVYCGQSHTSFLSPLSLLSSFSSSPHLLFLSCSLSCRLPISSFSPSPLGMVSALSLLILHLFSPPRYGVSSFSSHSPPLLSP